MCDGEHYIIQGNVWHNLALDTAYTTHKATSVKGAIINAPILIFTLL